MVEQAENFLVNGFKIDYVRKPRRVSLFLERGCDLPEGVHQKIGDLTVERILRIYSDPNYQSKAQENIVKVTN